MADGCQSSSLPCSTNRNVVYYVYGMRCGSRDCQECCVGEIKQALGTRMYQHQRPSSIPAQTSVVYTHLKSAVHAFSLKNIVVLDREEQWHRRGVKEAI